LFLWNPSPTSVLNPSTRQPAAGAKAYFMVGGTPTTPLAVYTADDGAATHPNPVVADTNGVFPPIFIPYGPYGYRIVTSAGTAIGNSVLTVPNPAPPDSGGGGGIVVTQSQIFQTGDPMWLLRTGNRDGWVLMNDGTIGNVGSGGTLRANADAQALFIYLHDNLTNTYAPVSGGRTTAAADFAANKTIGVPTMAGYVAGCLDNLSGAAANRLQRSTTISTTNSSTAATVASASGLVIGMKVISANVQAGTTITAISGTSITLSANASATASGTAVRFSVFDDAQLIGAVGGVAQEVQLLDQMPQHNHGGATGADGAHNHTYTQPQFGPEGDTGLSKNVLLSQGTAATSGAPNHTHTIAAQGGSLAHSLVQPTRLGAWFMKL